MSLGPGQIRRNPLRQYYREGKTQLCDREELHQLFRLRLRVDHALRSFRVCSRSQKADDFCPGGVQGAREANGQSKETIGERRTGYGVALRQAERLQGYGSKPLYRVATASGERALP